jgi:hypothetical protein
MIVKVELRDRRDKRFKKETLITTRDNTIVYMGEATPSIIKKMDGSKTSYFLANVQLNIEHTEKSIVTLDTRVNTSPW